MKAPNRIRKKVGDLICLIKQICARSPRNGNAGLQHAPAPGLTKREQFLPFVFIGALAQDLADSTTDEAAKAFLLYCGGRTDTAEQWMLSKGTAK